MTEEMQTKTCPYCGEVININAIKCKHCGEFLNENQQEQTTESETKICPFCGEEIAYKAVKCKHCGEFLNTNNSSQQSNGDRIARADVNEEWKKRFRAVDFFVEDGKWWKYRPGFWKTSWGERWKMNSQIYFSDFLSTLSTWIFGGFYYLFKGMWLKFIVYGILSFFTCGVLWILFPYFAPFDYYRLKVLGKQW